MIIDEEEIKIEYLESPEIDPLSDKIQIKAKHPINETNANSCDGHLSTINLSQDNVQEESRKTLVINDGATWYSLINDYGKYVCKFCERQYLSVTTLRYHVNTKHPDKARNLKNISINKKRKEKPQCHLCKEKFKFTTDLKAHVQQMHDLDVIRKSCFYCNASFGNIIEISQHVLSNHNKPYKKMYICDICGYRTYKLYHYKQHSYTHSQEKNKKCQFCNYATNRKENLKIHERIHMNDKCYVCTFESCTYKCSDKTSLHCHRQQHYPEKNMLFCDQCGYKTVYRQSLKAHIETHKRKTLKL